MEVTEAIADPEINAFTFLTGIYNLICFVYSQTLVDTLDERPNPN